VDSSDLTPEQAERLKVIVGRQLRFLNRMVGRMQQQQFPVDGPAAAALTPRPPSERRPAYNMRAVHLSPESPDGKSP
jgi:hypothetical protein